MKNLNNKKVSVIIPNYNHAPFLEKRIDSVLNQSYKNFEVLLLDDCSTDESRIILKKYKNNKRIKKVIFNDSNSGSTFKQWQLGLEHVSGEYVWIAESDDYSDKTFIEKMVKNISKSKKIGLVYCQSYEVDSVTKRIDKIKIVPSPKEISTIVDGKSFLKKYMIDKNSIPNVSSVLFRKSYIKKNCGYGKAFSYAGDWFIYIKILCESNIYIEPEFLNYFRSHDETTRAKRDIPQWIWAYEELLRIQNLLLLNAIVTGPMYHKNVYKIIQNIHFFRNVNIYFDDYLGGKTRDLCIFGTSPLGVFFYSLIKKKYPKINVKYFIDRKAENGSYMVEDKNVYTLNEIRSQKYIPSIFIASVEYYDEIAQELKKANLQDKILNTNSMSTLLLDF